MPENISDTANNALQSVTPITPQTQEILDAMDDLINSDGGVELDGLDLDTVAENFVEVKYGDTLSNLSNKEEAESLKERWTSYYKEGEGRLALQMEINTIKSNFVAARDQLTYIADAAASAVASNAVPSVITVGTATSSPNPAYYLIENSTKANQLRSMAKNVEANLVTLLKSSAQIAFPIPSAVTSLIETLSTVKQTINTIPV